MLTYDNVRINRSEVLIFNVAVPPWETPVLVAVNGDDRCFNEGRVQTRREAPDPQGEYDRLDSKYGVDADSGQPYVALVYGPGQLGVQRLATAIRDALARDRETEPVVTTPTGDVGDMADADLVAMGLIDAPAAGGAVPISE